MPCGRGKVTYGRLNFTVAGRVRGVVPVHMNVISVRKADWNAGGGGGR